ncbi:uncharacterized protein LOC116852500 [Odontomachus brunneus]|uniref:uncharacterized protein LOC116852500 n=1 Tax=Odontomachus brunneus TaxID=486640 RepID=UPI0013F2040A|nr:uncharacterized protein LOC116852500 [Odontomachus brunneus]
MDSPQNKEALMALFRVLITTQSNLKESIVKVMSSIMTKAVELQYSGTGKIINGQSKRNFSNILIEKFGNSVDLKKLPGQVGLWLSRARDCEGGRKERNKNN